MVRNHQVFLQLNLGLGARITVKIKYRIYALSCLRENRHEKIPATTTLFAAIGSMRSGCSGSVGEGL